MNRNGTVIFQNNYYFFRLIDFNLILEKADQLTAGNENEAEQKTTLDVIFGMEFKSDAKGKRIMFKVDGAIYRVHAGRYEATIDYYIVFEDKIDYTFQRIQFSSPELNHFYDVQKGYTVQVQSDSEHTNKIILNEQTEESFDFQFHREKISCVLAVAQSVQFDSTNPLKLTTQWCCDFEERQPAAKFKEISLLIKEFLQFISYRQDVSFLTISLLNPVASDDTSGNYKVVGELVINQVKYSEQQENQVTMPLIQFDEMKDNISDILRLLAEKKIYLEHLPRTAEERVVHSIEKTILTAAAFEWEFAKIYPHAIEDYHLKQLQYEQEFIGWIDLKINECKGKEKKYYKNMKYLIQHSNMNLAKRIQYALADVQPIIGDMIEKMYSVNQFEENNKIHEIAERIQSKRNIFAHGNLAVQWSEEEEILMVGDLVTLQLLYYAIILKEAGIQPEQVKRSIDSLFNLGYFL